MLTRLQQQTKQPDGSENWRQLQAWYQSPLGQRFVTDEKRIIDGLLPNLFGYFLLQAGCPGNDDWLSGSRVSCRIRLDQNGHEVCPLVNCQGMVESLPIKSDSLDIVLLPHVLDFSISPHEVLREAERVLIPEGHLIILGFNPFSLWNLVRLGIVWKKRAPWTGRFLSPHRVMDWLALLGFDVVQKQGFYFRPPLVNEKMNHRLAFIERLGRRFWPALGAGYVLLAKKRVQTLTPIRPRWRAQRKVVAEGLIKS